MIVRIVGHLGRIHHAAGQADLQHTRPVYAYCPIDYFDGDGFDRRRYLTSRWPAINAGANLHAIGSHVLPDPQRLADCRSRCPVLSEFLSRLETIAAVKSITHP